MYTKKSSVLLANVKFYGKFLNVEFERDFYSFLLTQLLSAAAAAAQTGQHVTGNGSKLSQCYKI